MTDDEGTFRALYRENFRIVLGYALRRTASAEDAADVTAETMLVAWRKLPEVPVGPEARLWLYGVARRVLANHRRGQLRRDRLGERLRAQLSRCLPADPAEPVAVGETVHAALRRLSPADRELVTLIAWEDLSPREAAQVLGIPATAVRTRLYRARGRLRALLGDVQPAAGHVSNDGHSLVPEEQ